MRIEQLDSYQRTHVSAEARTLLCYFAAGDVTRPMPLVAADWEEVFQRVCSNGLLGLAQHCLAQATRRDYPPQAFRQHIHAAQRLNAMRMLLMHRKVHAVLAHLDRSGPDWMVVKGMAVAYSVYPDPTLRSFNDLDLLVRERDWSAMHRALCGMGFTPEKDWPDPPPKLTPQAVLYEMKYWHPEMGLLVEVHYDDILNAGLASRDVEGFWRRATRIGTEGIPINVMSLEDQLVHLCAHAHYHGYTRLNWLSDIACIVRDHGAAIDWECVLATVRTEEAHVSVYYSLSVLERLLGVGAPCGVMGALRPDGVRRWFHERYMPEKCIVSLQPMGRPDFSFYFQPLFKRLLPDLLVMGRRREKLRYLCRLLLPPRDWLLYYYQLNDTRMLPLHYVLHPLKLAYHYLDEIAGMLVQSRTNLERR